MRSATPERLLSPVWPLPRSLATTKGISVDVFSSPYLDVSVQAVPLIYLWIQYMIHDVDHVDCSIRKSADQSVLTTPRSLSQLTTSFIGSQCQGIHPALMFALPFASSESSRFQLILIQRFIMRKMISFRSSLKLANFVVLPDFKFFRIVCGLFDVVVCNSDFTLNCNT